MDFPNRQVPSVFATGRNASGGFRWRNLRYLTRPVVELTNSTALRGRGESPTGVLCLRPIGSDDTDNHSDGGAGPGRVARATLVISNANGAKGNHPRAPAESAGAPSF